eukprot:gene12303-13572_t
MEDIGNDLSSNRLHLKGQMMFIEHWKAFIYLASPVLEDLDDMYNVGLYLNDFCIHDASRDLVLIGNQKSAELKLALDQELEKSAELEESMKKLDQEMQKTDKLLYSMIPKTVANRLRKGDLAVNTCEHFDNVSILFSDVVGFTTICSKITPMEVVDMLNCMYTSFDTLSEENSVYKVETIGDAYMVVSGVPERIHNHAQRIADMAFAMLKSVTGIKNPSNPKHNLQIRIGIHSGSVVAGVVGIKMPRYCLFGDTVNTASRMEANSVAMSIHISETTKNELDEGNYVIRRRGAVQIKGKGMMNSYWLIGQGSSSQALSAMSVRSIEDADVEEIVTGDNDTLIDESMMKSLSYKADKSRNAIRMRPSAKPILGLPNDMNGDTKNVPEAPSHYSNLSHDDDTLLAKSKLKLTKKKSINGSPGSEKSLVCIIL